MNPKRLEHSLLLALDALVTERSVTKASQRLHLSQPAMSRALARLRSVFDDPILVRGTKGMVPTPKALQIHEPTRRALDEIEQSIASLRHFDPATDTSTFRLGVVDYAEMIVMPELMSRVRTQAPHVKVITRSIGSPHALEGLASGEVDLAMAFFAQTSESLHRRTLGTDDYVCIAKRRRIRAGELTLQRYLSACHLAIAPAGNATRSRLDLALKDMGCEREIVYYAAHFSTTGAIVERTDLVATLHRRAAIKLVQEFDVEIHPLPTEIGMDALVLSEVWHERTHQDKAHRWLRALVAESCDAVFAPPHGSG